jgi:hypothetical protein
MTPAAVHRIAFKCQDVEAFLRLGSGFVLTAPFVLAIRLVADMEVAVAKATEESGLAKIIALASFIAFAGYGTDCHSCCGIAGRHGTALKRFDGAYHVLPCRRWPAPREA